VTDQPSNATDQARDLPEHASGPRDLGQTGVASGPTGEPAAVEASGDVVAEVPAEQPPAEEAMEVAPAEALSPEAEGDQAAAVEASGDVVAEAPAEQPPAEKAVEVAPAEALSAEAEGVQAAAAEPIGDVVAEVPADQPPAEEAVEVAPAEALSPEAEGDQAAAVEGPGDMVAEAPAEQPPAEEAVEVAPAEALSPEAEGEQAAAAEGSGDVVAEAPAEQPAPEAPEEAVAAGPEAAERETGESEAIQPAEEEPKSENMNWYILKVQSNREDSIREGLLRRVAIAGLGRYFGQVIVPTEKVTEFKGGKRRVTKRKLYPGYLVVEMEINDDTWFLVRETPGIGDFTGAAGHPTPMLPHEVSRILARQEEKSEKAPKLKIGFRPGDQVKINEGTFENFEGEVESIDQTNGQVTVMINIFGRSTPVTLEYWQIEAI
jgi:transcriptional antiterminator NusG